MAYKTYILGALLLLPLIASAQGIGTLDQWTSTTSPSAAITQRTFGKALKVTGLTTGQCLTLDANNLLTTTTCGSGSTWPFTPSSYAGVANQSTTTPFWLNGTQLIASSTLAVNATTTNQDITGLLTFNGVTGNSWDDFCTTITGGAGLCDGTDATGSAVWPFTTGLTTYGTTTQATTTPFWAQGGLFASTTASIPAIAATQGGSGPVATFLGGNVGIASTSPSQILSISGDGSNPTLLTIDNGVGTPTLRLGFSAGGNQAGVFGTVNNAGFLMQTNATNRLAINSNGKVGIATTTPNWALQANQLTSVTTPQFAISDTTAGAGLKHWTFGVFNGNLHIGTSTDLYATSTPAAFSIDNDGKVKANDSVNKWNGVLSPTRSFVLGSATTTTWTASTTGTGFSPHLVMPFAGTLRQVRCQSMIGASGGSFIGVNTLVNGSNATPSYFVASSTIGKISFTSGNTFTAGQAILANFGTTTTATATSISCTFDVTET